MQVRIGDSSASHSGASLGIAAATDVSKSPASVRSDVPVSELAALAASGAKLNRKQRRALERQAGKLPSNADGDTQPAVSAIAPSPEPASAHVTSSSSEAVVGGTLAELTALKASGKALNRKQRRAFERLSSGTKAVTS